MPKGVYVRKYWPPQCSSDDPETKAVKDRERIFANLEIGDCWEWSKGLDQDGYGRTTVGSRARGTARNVSVHRYVYTQLVGSIPEGFHLDHLCRNRKCANPDHLQPVPCAVNIRRGQTGQANKRKTHCPQGHSYADAFLEYKPNGGVTRHCRTCSNRRRRERALRARERKAA